MFFDKAMKLVEAASGVLPALVSEQLAMEMANARLFNFADGLEDATPGIPDLSICPMPFPMVWFEFSGFRNSTQQAGRSAVLGSELPRDKEFRSKFAALIREIGTDHEQLIDGIAMGRPLYTITRFQEIDDSVSARAKSMSLTTSIYDFADEWAWRCSNPVYAGVTGAWILARGKKAADVLGPFHESRGQVMAAGDSFFHALQLINDKDSWIVRETWANPPKRYSKNAKPSEKRPQYTVLTLGEIQVRLGLGVDNRSEDEKRRSPAPHPRRSHVRVLRHERFGTNRGRKIVIPEVWIGKREAIIGNKRYSVQTVL